MKAWIYALVCMLVLTGTGTTAEPIMPDFPGTPPGSSLTAIPTVTAVTCTIYRTGNCDNDPKSIAPFIPVSLVLEELRGE